VVNKKRQLALKIEYPQSDYDRLGNWQHWGPDGSYTGALEPMTAGVEGRPVDRERGWFRCIEPGKSVIHRCDITVSTDQRDLKQLLALNRP
jgi:hypothetical protein